MVLPSLEFMKCLAKAQLHVWSISLSLAVLCWRQRRVTFLEDILSVFNPAPHKQSATASASAADILYGYMCSPDGTTDERGSGREWGFGCTS